MFRPIQSPRKSLSSARVRNPGRCVESLETRVLFAAGDLDTSFGSGGFARADFGDGTERVSDIAVDAARGRILATGYVQSGTSYRLALAAFKLDGKPDTTFSGDGKLLTNLGGGGALEVLPDGRFYVHSPNAPGGNVQTLTRFKADGSVDTSFSGDGKLTLPDYGSIETAPGGKLVHIVPGSSNSATVTRYNANGSLDTTLGGDGSVTVPFSVSGYEWSYIHDADVAPDGKIVLAGSVFSYTDEWDAGVVRLNTDGTYDRTFDGDGHKILSFGYIDDDATAVTVAPNNDVLVGIVEGERQAFVSRLSPSGAVVPFANPAVRGETAAVRSIAVAPDGKVVIASTINRREAGEDGPVTFLHRVKPGGGMDPDFGGHRAGRTIHPVSAHIAIDPAGNILVADYTNDREVSIARYRNSGGENAAGIVTGSGGQITVTGTTRGDEIRIEPASGGKISVTVNGYRRQYTASTISGILVNAGNGDDNVVIAPQLNLPATMKGGAGLDTLTGGAGNDRIEGGDGGLDDGRAESLRGGLGNDTLIGGNGTDALFGEAGNDRLEGGNDADHLDGGLGADYLAGGADDDVLDYSTRTRGVTVGLDNVADDGEPGEKDNARDDLEWVIGGSGNDLIKGSNAYNVFRGMGGNDTLLGGGGNDSLAGGDGNDLLDGQAGADDMYGGFGTDTVDYSSRTLAVFVDLAGFAANNGQAGENDRVPPDIENINGGSGNDNLVGSDQTNRIDAGAGNDTVTGGAGRDSLYGRAGNDTFFARGDNAIDFIDGGSGTDKAQKDPDDFAQFVESFLA